jgi:hypothetical protein
VRRAKSLLTFAAAGAAAGIFFSLLLSIPRLTTFWYRKTDKFLVPTYRYYLGLGVILLLALAAAHTFSRIQRWLRAAESESVLRQAGAAFIVAVSAVVPYLVIGSRDFDAVIQYVLAIVLFVLLISSACWILSTQLYYSGVLLNLVVIPVTLTIMYVLTRLLHFGGDLSEFLTFLISLTLFSTSCGYWLTRATDSNRREL